MPFNVHFTQTENIAITIYTAYIYANSLSFSGNPPYAENLKINQDLPVS